MSSKNPRAEARAFHVAAPVDDSNGVLALASRIASMPSSEAGRRYHELVDIELQRCLTTLERFELGCIEARLDEQDSDPLLEARNREWESERTNLLRSLEHLLVKLRR